MSALQDAAARVVEEADVIYGENVQFDLTREAFSDAAVAFRDWALYQDDDALPEDAFNDGADHEHADAAAYHAHQWYDAHHNPDAWIEEALSEFGTDLAMDSGNIMRRLKELGAYMEARAAFNEVVDAVSGAMSDMEDEEVAA